MAPATGSGLWQPQPVPPRQCVMCGAEGRDVATTALRFREGEPYGYGPRCRDHEACWRRCLDNGDEWLIDDGRPARVSDRGADHPGSMTDGAGSGIVSGHSSGNDPTQEDADIIGGPATDVSGSDRLDEGPEIGNDEPELLDFGEAPS